MGKFTEYKIPLKSLQKGRHTFNFHLGKTFFVDMESADVRDADLDTTVVIDYNGDLYNVDFAVKGNVTLLCDRCLDELTWPVDATYNISVKYGDNYNDDSDTLLEIPFSDNDLNVAYMLYDTVSLAIPIKHVHPQGKCNRAMTTILNKHRANDEYDDELIDDIDDLDDVNDDTDSGRTTDPRWDALKGFGSDE